MQLTQYTDTKREDSFCYWIENVTRDLGSIRGGSSVKFGIYEYINKPKKIGSDNQYAWISQRGDNKDEVFESVRNDIVKVATAAANGNFEDIDDDSIQLGHAYKWKIAFLYSDKKLFNAFTKESLIFIANQLVGHKQYNNNTKTSELQRVIMQNKPADKSLWDYGNALWKDWEQEMAKNNPNSWIKYFAKITQAIREYDNNHSKLVELLKSTNMEEITSFLIQEDDISPFAVFEMVNSTRYKNDNDKRFEILEILGDTFEIEEDFPFTLPIIPDNSQKTDYCQLLQKRKDFIELSWKLFDFSKQAKIKETEFVSIFNQICEIEDVGSSSITLYLFWCAPKRFVPTIKEVRTYINEKYKISISQQITGEDYFNLLSFLKNQKITPSELVIKALKKYNQGENMSNNNLEKINTYVTLLKNTKNLILHGAPGTGKTHLANDIVAYMHFNKLYLDLTDEEKNQLSEYKGFVQFHPSYDYTDFVEGIRPQKSAEGITNSFIRMDGVFKDFCKKAVLSQSVDSETIAELKKDATVWKLSLKGTGDNPIRRDCLDNNYIRLGFNEEPDYISEETPAERGKNELNAFQNKMQKGDIVLSCWSNKEIDAIGIITSDYYVDKENHSDYWRFRNVKWLVKDIRENIYELNDRTVMTLSSVYKLSIPIQAIMDIVRKHTQPSSVSTDKPFVFIIDEINRGELSKIFGELFFAIDPGYRGRKELVKTQYQNLIPDNDIFKKGFYIPDNVYIIGTMNDIDRSVESMDLAMRRRFTFKEISAMDSEEAMLTSSNPSLKEINDNIIDELKKRMERLNNKIVSEEIGLSPAYQIGAAYFLKYTMYKNESKPFDCIWDYNLEPLLQEYLRGQGGIREKITKLKAAYKGE